MYQYDSLFISLVKHIEYLEHILLTTSKIELAVLKNGIETVSFLVENRERLFSITELSQKKVEREISMLSKITEELKDILVIWSNDVSILIEKANQINDSISIILEEKKQDLTKEIATIFNIRQVHEGYNLNSVRK
jgi:hypothetical protein